MAGCSRRIMSVIPTRSPLIGLALGGLVCLLLGAPPVSAAPAFTPIVIHLPFTVPGGWGGYGTVYSAPNGCGAGRLLHHPIFYNLTGVFMGGVSAASHSCPLNSTTQSYESGSEASEQSGWLISIPGSISGNRSARTNATLDLASADHFNARACPSTITKRGSAGPALLGCEVTAYRSLSITVTFVDLTYGLGGMPYSTGSVGSVYQSTTFGLANLTTCYTAHPGGWTCFNNTGPINTSASKIGSANVAPSFSWNASNQRVSLWSNATGLQGSHTYAIGIEVDMWTKAYVFQYGLAHQWPASAGAFIHLGHGGKLLQINSVTIS